MGTVRDNEGPYCYAHPRPALSTDIVVVRAAAESGNPSEILLVQRGKPPYEGTWALPGGFVAQGESPKGAAKRELAEETGITGVDLRQVGVFGKPGRDPRGWVVSVAFLTAVARNQIHVTAGDDAAAARWWPLDDLPPLAFDHDQIIDAALRELSVSGGTGGGS
ncbi:MAG: NUDIX domain-containing protein [Anaerolineae bacterium]